MVDGLVGVEGKGVPGLHVDGGGGSAGGAADVAPEIRRGQSRHWGIVVCVFAQVGVDGEFLGVDPELLEDVVGFGGEGGAEEGECQGGGEFHDGWWWHWSRRSWDGDRVAGRMVVVIEELSYY